jgi:hypothetical protein
MEVSNMTASLVLFLGSLLVMMCLGVPLFVTLAMASIVYMLASGQTFLVMMMARRIFAGINSFTLLAIPLFILCGDLLSSGKVSKMLISFAESLVGTMRGSLAIVTTVASMFFGAVSGSGVATASAIGSVVAPEAEAKGYDKKFIASISKHAGAEISSRFIPPNTGSKHFTTFTISSGSLVLRHIGNASTPAKVLNRTALPSITGMPAAGPMSPSPKTAVPLLTTATMFPLQVYSYTLSGQAWISLHGSATPGV